MLWWAAKHRHHHLHSDTSDDLHSPRQSGFLYTHFGWIFSRRQDTVDFVKVADFARYPELMWLHRFELVPAVVLGVARFLIGGWPGLVVGFFWSTVLVSHATFSINSLAHVHGRKRYVTGDDSRNNWLLALITMGEGWHNNHHAYQSSVRQGFRWWEVDPTFYILKALSWSGLVWDLKTPPEAVLRNEQRLGARVIERAAERARGELQHRADRRQPAERARPWTEPRRAQTRAGRRPEPGGRPAAARGRPAGDRPSSRAADARRHQEAGDRHAGEDPVARRHRRPGAPHDPRNGLRPRADRRPRDRTRLTLLKSAAPPLGVR